MNTRRFKIHFFGLVLIQLTVVLNLFSQTEYQLKSNAPSQGVYVASLVNNAKNRAFIAKNNINEKYHTENWIFVTMNELQSTKYFEIAKRSDFYQEIGEATLLNDTSRVRHRVDEVHQGINGLPTGFTGKNVILGIIDTGLDFKHQDFLDSTGKTRVYRYWDQTKTTSTPTSPQPYNYGELWTKQDIDNGKCTAVDDAAHGTNVCGIAAGNGRANGRNKGMAPDATIIIVESNLTVSNYTLTIADACDYIFKVADSLGMPAVINISSGVQFGSHDGSDPASEKMERLLDEKSGRIIVAAAGNSGDNGSYHLHADVDADTSFFWSQTVPKGIAGSNSIYMGIWADSTDFASVRFSTAANLPSNTFAFRGRTNFRTLSEVLAKDPKSYRDTLFSKSGNKLAYVDYYATVINHVVFFEWVCTSVDSLNYLYQFTTTGKGKYDAWGGSLNKKGSKTYNDFITNIPSTSTLPAIANYHMADSLQTIYSSYISSEKVITVGNIINRQTYLDKNGNWAPSAGSPGKLASTSSIGPNRKGVLKPDICASGNNTMTAAPLYVLAASAFNFKIDEKGMHYANGGTSMASPAIAGMAALYLERCPKASYGDFKRDIINTAKPNNFTGNLPNFAYGNGIADIHAAIKNTNEKISFAGDSMIICKKNAFVYVDSISQYTSPEWNDNSNSFSKKMNLPGYYSLSIRSKNACLQKDSIQIKFSQTAVKPKIAFLSKDSTFSCEQKTLLLQASGAYQYEWGNGNLNDSILVKQPGWLKLTANDKNGCSGLDSIQLNYIEKPLNVSIISLNNSTTLNCKQKSLNLKATAGSTFLWSLGDSIHSSVNSVNTPGYIRLQAIDSNGCSGLDSIEIKMDTMKPTIDIHSVGYPKISCDNEPVLLKAYGGTNYEWLLGNHPTKDTLTVFFKGTYSVKGVANNGCFSLDSIVIEKEDYPIIPTITLVDSFLVSSQSNNYQWYLNDELLVGDTLQKLKITSNGKYFVSTFSGRCSVSSSYYFSNLNTFHLDMESIKIYPNPLHGNILFMDGIKGNEAIKVYSISGDEILYSKISENTLQLDNLECGMYIIEFISQHTKTRLKFVKNE